MTEPRKKSGTANGIALFALSAAALAAQVLLVRVFSYTLNHGFVYMAISLAMLGFSAGGVLVASSPRLEELGRNWGMILGICCLGFAVTLVTGAMIFSRHSGAISPAGGLSIFQVGAWPLLVFVLPFFFAGAGIAATLVLPGEGLARRYAVNLIGSAAGCLLAQPLLVNLGAPAALQALALMVLVAALAIPGRSLRLILAIGIAAAVLPLLRPEGLPAFKPDAADQLADLAREIKRSDGGEPKLIHEAWDPVGRIEVHELPGAFGLIGARAPLYFYSQDAGAGSVILGAGGRPEVARDLADGTLYGLGAHLRPEARALVVGIGGGPDLLALLAEESTHVIGVDINAATVSALRHDFAGFLGIEHELATGRLELVHADGRGFVRGHPESFDLIQMTGADTYAANPAGASILSESYLYTEEAFRDYLDCLKPGGVLAVTRFGIESQRIMKTAIAALEDRGIADPLAHLLVVGQGPQSHWNSVLVFRDPVRPEEIATIEDLCAKSAPIAARCDMPAYHAIGFSFSDPMNLLFRPGVGHDRATVETSLTSAGKDLRPVSDDRPYFFQFDRLDGLPWNEVFGRHAFDRHHWGLADYLRVALQIGVVALLLVCLPFMSRRLRSAGPRSLVMIALGFAGIGTGFMFLEVVLMQRCALFLGHPNLAISVVLAMLLVASGIGSALAGRLADYPRVVVVTAILLIVAWSFAFARLSPDYFAARLDHSVAERIGFLALWLLPLGLVLGAPFPTGLAILGRSAPRLAVWAIAVNGFASVTASLAAIPLTMTRGFAASFTVAAAAYAVGMIGLLFCGGRKSES